MINIIESLETNSYKEQLGELVMFSLEKGLRGDTTTVFRGDMTAPLKHVKGCGRWCKFCVLSLIQKSLKEPIK